MRVCLVVFAQIVCCAVCSAQYFRLDLSFTPAIDARLRGIGLQPDGKIIIGGDFINVNGVPRSRVARLHADGTIDESFVPTAEPLNNGGQVIVTASNIYAGIQRYDFSGNLEATYGPGYRYAVDSQQRKVIGGITEYQPRRMHRWKSDGSLDSSFSPWIDYARNNRGVNAVGVQWDAGAEKILIGGKFSDANGSYYPGLARLNEDGSTDTNFIGHGMESPIVALATWQDGKFYTATEYAIVRRHSADGRADPGFLTVYLAGPYTDDILLLAPDPSGALLVSADRCTIGCTPIVFRFQSDGTPDTNFSLAVGGYVHAVAYQPDGAILIGGSFTNVNCVRRPFLARLIPSDMPDPLPCGPPPPPPPKPEPELEITRIRGAKMVCCWPTNYPEYTLQAARRLRPNHPEREKWVTVTNEPVAGESTVCVTNRIARWGKHYRLVKQ